MRKVQPLCFVSIHHGFRIHQWAFSLGSASKRTLFFGPIGANLRWWSNASIVGSSGRLPRPRKCKGIEKWRTLVQRFLYEISCWHCIITRNGFLGGLGIIDVHRKWADANENQFEISFLIDIEILLSCSSLPMYIYHCHLLTPDSGTDFMIFCKAHEFLSGPHGREGSKMG